MIYIKSNQLVGAIVAVGGVPPRVGVKDGARVGVAVTMFTRMMRVCPTWILFLSVSLFCAMMSSTVVLNSAAIVSSVSPDWTM